MKNVYVITHRITGPAGHGEPGTPYLTLRTTGDSYSLGLPGPAFSTRQAAEDERRSLKYPEWWSVTELELK